MGVIYKLKDDVVQFIISQRQSNPLASCRQLAESASQKFGLQLSKSSVHDVLKESGIMTPRGRKPKDKFEIPQEKKIQIQGSLSQIKLISPPVESKPIEVPHVAAIRQKQDTQVSPEYPQAGKIFLKAALWDLGIYSEQDLKVFDWKYLLTYSKGIKVDLENNKSFFIDLPLPIERCIKEAADGLVNNINPMIVYRVSDEELFKASMERKTGFKINVISIVDCQDHVLIEFNDIMELDRHFILENRVFVENNENEIEKRTRTIFFSQTIENNEVIDHILNLKGFDTISKDEKVITLLIDVGYENKAILTEAVEKLNRMFLYDEDNRLVKVKMQE